METVNKVLQNLGAGDIDERLEERLIDGILYAFQEQAVDANSDSAAFGREGQVMLDGFGTVVNALGERCKPYLKQIAGTIKWRLNPAIPSFAVSKRCPLNLISSKTRTVEVVVCRVVSTMYSFDAT